MQGSGVGLVVSMVGSWPEGHRFDWSLSQSFYANLQFEICSEKSFLIKENIFLSYAVRPDFIIILAWLQKKIVRLMIRYEWPITASLVYFQMRLAVTAIDGWLMIYRWNYSPTSTYFTRKRIDWHDYFDTKAAWQKKKTDSSRITALHSQYRNRSSRITLI